MDATLVEVFSQFGLAAAIIGVLFIQVQHLQRKLLDVIENNTRVMTELKGVIDKCQAVHTLH
jgi:hypothetical protein